ncbi:MAG: TetR/AcrR family transcriptional regulator [Candidatus Eisenbacteria bacterium]
MTTHRQRQAQATRSQILRSARELFLGQGYGATTIESIAHRAGVGVSTVYAVFGSKRGILGGLRETWAGEPEEREIYREAEDEPDPVTRLEMAAHATRRQWEAVAAVAPIVESAASVDPTAAAEWREALASRRRDLASFVRGFATHLKTGLELQVATAIFFALTRRELYAELVDGHRWTPDLYEAWLAATLVQQLLG